VSVNARQVTSQIIKIDGSDESGPQIIVQIDQATADALADAKQAADGAGGVVPGDVARQVSDPVCDALIAAGYGTNP
jgi:hypothetical protein